MTEFSSSTFDRYSGKWLIGTGVFELVLASLFLFFGATDEFLLFPFGLTAAILGITGFALVWFGLRARRSAAEAERISSHGPGRDRDRDRADPDRHDPERPARRWTSS